MSKKQRRPARGLTRRDFLAGVGATAGAASLAGRAEAKAPAGPRRAGPKKTAIVLNVNGKDREVEIEPRVTLLRALRNHLDVTGPKEICDRGACGGCSVLVDGLLVNSCMMLAMDAAGRKVVTPEGLADGDKLSPLQEAFCARDALQCGFCTPGMAMACKWLLDRHKEPSLETIKKELSGNICRCGTYTRVFEAVLAAAGKRGK